MPIAMTACAISSMGEPIVKCQDARFILSWSSIGTGLNQKQEY